MSEELYNLALFPLDEIVSLENDYAKNAGYTFPQKALLPGRQYKVENGGIETGRKECSIAILERLPIESKKSLSERIYAKNPLIHRERSEAEITVGKKKILEILNTRFLPYWSASPVASLRDAIIRNNGVYRIELRMTNKE